MVHVVTKDKVENIEGITSDILDGKIRTSTKDFYGFPESSCRNEECFLDSEKYNIIANEEIFQEWKAYGEVFFTTASIVQNDKILTPEALNQWYVNTNQKIREMRNDLGNIKIQKLIFLRDKTIQYIKNSNA